MFLNKFRIRYVQSTNQCHVIILIIKILYNNIQQHDVNQHFNIAFRNLVKNNIGFLGNNEYLYHATAMRKHSYIDNLKKHNNCNKIYSVLIKYLSNYDW
jgi:hypothetical protein